jgi:saccharopine dehydrogenase (NAD+, L-lysine-forming)
MEEFAEEFVGMKMMDYKDSAWKAAGWADLLRPREMDFGEPFGRKPCIPMFLEELRSLPDLYPSLQETGFYVGGLNWAVDWLMTPIVMIALTLWPTTPRVSRAMGKFLYWGLTTFSQPPFGTRLKVEATGLDKEGAPRTQELELSHVDGYAMTAIPVAATVLQYLSSSKEHPIRKPGLWLQGLAVDPQMLLVDMERMGIDIQPPLGQVETKGLPG